MMQSLPFFRTGFYALLLLNSLIIAALFLLPRFTHQSARGPGGAPLREDFTRILQLDEEQMRRFHQSAQKHRRQMDSISRQQQQIAPAYFGQLLDTAPVAPLDSISAALSALETAKLAITYTHFAEVKALLQPEQQKHYRPFLERAVESIVYSRKPPRRRPRQGPPPRNR